MSNIPDPESFGATEHLRYGQFAPNMTELPEAPGPATALCKLVDEAADRWHEFAEDTGDIHLSDFEDNRITILRLKEHNGEITTNPKPEPENMAVKGIRGWIQRLRQAQTSVQHTVTFQDDDTTIALNIVKLPSGTVSLRGTQTITTDEGPQTIELRKGINLEDAVVRATNLVTNGFPILAEAAIVERQKQPCTEIIGEEAVQVQKALEAIITPNKATDLGDRTAPERLTSYEVVQPNIDDQWSAKYLTVIERQGTTPPSVEGVEGRSIWSAVNFSSTVLNSRGEPAQLVVRVEGVYEEGTNRLLGAQVTYRSKLGVLETEEPLEVDPEDRRAIHAAIMHQVTPDNVIRTHEFKPE